MEFLQDIIKKNKKFLEDNENSLGHLKKDCNSFFKEIDNFLETGDISFFKASTGGKENAEPVPTNKRKGRQNKPALADITEVNTSPCSVNIKKEKVSDIQDISKELDVNIADTNAKIKTEIEEMPPPTKLPLRKKQIKSERTDVVKRSTRSRRRNKDANEDASNSNERNDNKISSDVIIQNTTVTTIEISDSEKDTETESEIEKNTCEPELKIRSTRSKMRKQKQDSSTSGVTNEKIDQPDENMRSTRTKTKQKRRVRSDSSEEPTTQLDRKKSRSCSNTDQGCNSVRTEYEDAVSAIEDTGNKKADINITYVASKHLQENDEQTIPSSLNSTVVVANPTIVVNPREHEELQKNGSENEGDQTEKGTPEPVKKTKGIKQVFSPYENTPLKKKVEAFEKLGAGASNVPMKLTGTKKKTQKKISKSKGDKVEDEERKKSVEKPRVFTPVMSKFHPKVCSTSKINKLHPNYGNDATITNESLLSVKSASALKASQAEFREREKRRQEKEREALRKREALLQAQTEEKRRRREERQQKAQQQREVLEKEKQMQLEAQRIKEEKYKQAMAEKEEKLQKQKEEAEKKRIMVKKKVNQLKEKEEAVKMPELRNITEMKVTSDKQGEKTKTVLKQKTERQHQHQSVPLYMTTTPPLLPTDDCYDSDDPEYERVKRNEPDWSRDRELREQQMTMIVAGEQIKNTFFCRQTHTPDLQEIFELIDPRKLKRTSSAIWRKPPRYTLMPTIADDPVFSEESD